MDDNTTNHETVSSRRKMVEITDAQTTRTFDRNSLVDAVWGEGLIQSLTPSERYPSMLSSAPGVRYKTRQADLFFTPDELFRFIAFALTPRQFFTIRNAAGNIFEIHDDFYDPETGEAFQPSIPIPQTSFDNKNDLFLVQFASDSDFYSLQKCFLYAFQVSIPHVAFDFVPLELGDPDFLQRDLDYNPHIKRGVVVFTQDYLGKPWTEEVFSQVNELTGRGVDIIPVWWGVTPEDVAEYLPALRQVDGLAAPDIDFRVVQEFFRFADSVATALSEDDDSPS